MSNLQFEWQQSYSRNTLGFICEINKPVHIGIDLKWIESFFKTHNNCQAIPVKSEASIIGIVERQRVFCNIIRNMSDDDILLLKDYVNRDIIKFNANDNIEYALNTIVQRSNAGEIFNVLVSRGNNLVPGTVNVRNLILHVMDLRREQLIEAETIQESLMGRKSISVSSFKAQIAVEMAYELGGDFSQLIRLLRDKYLITCFDVSGKNLSAAIYTGLIAGFFSTLEVTGQINSMKSDEILKGLNRLLLEKTPGEIFVTAILIYVDTVSQHMDVYNCGYGNVYVSSSEDSLKFKKFTPSLPPLGFDSIWNPLSGKEGYSIAEGVRLFTYSDGLSDAKNRQGEKFGEKRIMDFIRQNWVRTGEDFYYSFLDEIHSFIGKAIRADDISMMMLQF